MLIIDKDQVNNLVRRLSTPGELEHCRDELEKMLEIKSDLLWWAESGKCCSQPAKDFLLNEIKILESTLNFLKKGDVSQASSLLEDYMNLIPQSEGD